MNVESGGERKNAHAGGATAVASLSHDSTARGCPARHAADENSPRLPLDRATPLESTPQGDLIGIFEVAADGKAAREPRDREARLHEQS